jgi:hypothetical protein
VVDWAFYRRKVCLFGGEHDRVRCCGAVSRGGGGGEWLQS